ncbi:acetyl-CoA hydrolase/transferase C-terminal domain-containing protein [Leptospira santarosai]|uniref:acetyl-CoA hydrolase/transferase C-terminal domain-containing protein n=1 Tax=Leptospira santarosai TaxID=28183 RepID=UPI003D1600DF
MSFLVSKRDSSLGRRAPTSHRYRIANLYGKNLRQRAKALIEIAHPDHREKLEKEALARFQIF